MKERYLLIEIENCIPFLIDLQLKKVVNWPQGNPGSVEFDVKVVDGGVYTLYDSAMNELVQYEGYVPEFLPNEWGDYFTMNISKNGNILNMPDHINFDEFYEG